VTDVARVARLVQRMQADIDQLIGDRTDIRALVAVSELAGGAGYRADIALTFTRAVADEILVEPAHPAH